jgi:hypothetical protein
MGSLATSQLNVRMDAKLRSVGDAVLERVGITPAEVMRALWAKIARGVEDCEQALSMFADQEDPIVSSRGKEFLARIEGWHDELFALVEAPRTSYVAPTDEELEEMLYDEWLAGEERGS